MIKILCLELFEAIFTHWRSKYTSKTAIETLSSLPYKKILRNMVVRGLHLLGKECKWWKLLGHAVQTEHYRISNPNNF